MTIAPIVVATDFSPASDRAVNRAAMLAAQFGAELHLLHVISPLETYPTMAGSLDRNAYDLAAGRVFASKLAALSGRMESRYAIKAHEIQRVGRAHNQIANYSESIGAQLVVAGSRGENTLMHVLLGSVAWRLLRVRKGPVLIVRQTPVVAYRKALSAIDYSPDSYNALEWAAKLASEVHVLHVIPNEDETTLRDSGLDNAAIRQRTKDMHNIASNLMNSLLERQSIQAYTHIESGYAPEVILERAANWHGDLITLGRHGHSGLEEYLLGSVSKDVAQEANCDVLVTCAPEGHA